ncbi:type III-B CRISPR module RAMP protein Cmr1 [Thermodesulforhabdus norvegica]|uniref:CRISPR-associated protein Cmr1 n=1 Tax=Thermodesulforhabdus norvegica TaxID=39841 RepID=A0A1I4TA37_9BACT|nr:type III-B CRISPR module RAMP protein Cmr1 [Thermodesulforhabdus norvegica]SFM73658.1 CRISPR-associated protein Cmr1 [Thermodesulforhabdus norvegica]
MNGAGLLRRRFGKRKVIELSCKIVTPMFLGDASQDAALRPEPFKGLLRYWWRVAAGTHYKKHDDLLDAENNIFGGAGGGRDWGKSLISLNVEGNPKKDNTLPAIREVSHREVGRNGRNIRSLLLYLGYGPILCQKGQVRCVRSYLAPDEKFTLKLSVPEGILSDNNEVEGELLKRAIYYLMAFGAAGSRSRNGWGSFQVENFGSIKNLVSSQEISPIPVGDTLFSKDYPYCLGASEKGLVLWRTKRGYNSWSEAMKEMAQIYIDLRTQFSADGSHDVGERHLLGFPITNHLAKGAPNWGRRSRHASPLRIFFRIKEGRYYGFILHLPFGISNRMRQNAAGKVFFSEKVQFQVWEKVYQILDDNNQLVRVGINDCF